MYLDAIERLVDLAQTANDEFYPDILEYLKIIAEGGAGTSGGADGGSIENMVKSINGVDADKANSISNLFTTLSNDKLTGKIVDNSQNLTKTIDGLTSAINKVDVDADKIKDVETLVGASSAIIGISRALTLSAPFLVVGAVMSFALIPIVWSISKAFSFLDRRTIRNIDDGGDALRDVGWSLIVFSGGIAIATALIGYSVLSNPVGLLSLFGIIGLTGLTFALIGKFNENIVDGAWTVAGMSLSLMLFSFSVKTASAWMESVSMESILKLGLVLGGTALIYGLAGKFAGQILMGALAFAGVGLSLMLLTNPLESISKTIDKNSHVLWQLPVMLGGLGVVFALGGATMPLILAGSFAFGAVGLSLMSIGAGLKSMSDIGDFDPDNFKNALSGMVEGFTSIGLKDMILIPLKLPAILSMALALGTIGMGMKAYKNNADWTDADADQFKYTIQSFVEAFSMEGVDYDAVEDAIDATWCMGQNLEKLAKGIKAWEEIDFDIDLVKENITNILGTVPSVFANVGKMNTGGMEVFGFTFTRGDVEDGIESTMNMGKNLVNLSKGIKAWEEIDFDINKVKGNVSAVLNSIPSVFAKIGKQAKASEGIFTDSDHIRGGEVVESMANTLNPLARGVKAWQEIDFDVNKVKNNIKSVLLALPSVFAEIGKQAKASEGIFTDSDHMRGAEVAQEFVKPIRSVADLVKSLNGENIDPKKVSNMITSVFGAMGKANQFIDKKAMNTLWSLSGAMKKISKEFPKFNKGFKEFADIIKEIEEGTVKRFMSLAMSVEKMSKSQVSLIKASGDKSTSVVQNIIKQVVPQQQPVEKRKEKEESEKEKKERIEKEKKLSVNEILVSKLGDMNDTLADIRDQQREMTSDIDDMRKAMVETGIKVK